MKKHFYLALALAGLVSCGDGSGADHPANLLASNDFEAMEGWNGDAPTPPSLTREKAHSGNYAMRVGPDVEYASGYIGALGKLSPTRLSKVQVKAWVYVPGGEPAAALITQVMDPATPGAPPLLWDGLPLSKSVSKRSEWVQIEKTLTLPATVNPNCKLYVYLWRGTSPAVAYIDDMQILRVE